MFNTRKHGGTAMQFGELAFWLLIAAGLVLAARMYYSMAVESLGQ
jgi:hypothetical protein